MRHQLSLRLCGVFIVLPALLFAVGTSLHSHTPGSMQFPTPIQVLDAFPTLATTLPLQSSAWQAMWVTFTRVLFSVSCSLAIGVIFGLVLGTAKGVWLIAQPTVDFLRSIPITFFLPAATLLVGASASYLPWVLSVIPGALILMLQIRQGVERISPERIHAFILLSGRQTRVSIFLHLTLREIIPEIVAGLRFATSYAIVIISVLEFMSVGSAEMGFGFLINQLADRPKDAPAMFAGILAFGALGFLLNWALETLEDQLSVWRS